MNLIQNMFQTPIDVIQTFKIPNNYLGVALNSFSPEARELAADLKSVATAAVALANRATAMRRDLEGQFDETPRIVLNSDNAIEFDSNFSTADLSLEVALFEREMRKACKEL